MKSVLFFLVGLIITTNLYSQKNEYIYYNINQGSITFTHYNIYANCAAKFSSKIEIVDFNIYITEIDTSIQKADCLCFFNDTIIIQNLIKGVYSINFYRQEDTKYGYPIDTVIDLNLKELIEINPTIPLPTTSFKFNQSDCFNPSSIEELEYRKPISIIPYPNPAISYTTLPLINKETNTSEICIYDIYGNKIQNLEVIINLNDSNIYINTSNLQTGVYNCKIESVNNTYTTTFVKIN